MSKQIILTADDFGCCDFIDDGIEFALRKGKINSVAVFVTHKDSAERIKKLLRLKKELQGGPNGNFGIGLHFSITSGQAISGKSSLTIFTEITEKEKYFREAFGYDFLLSKKEDLEAELIAQLDLIRSILGDEPVDHLSHHHGIIYLSNRLFNVYTRTLNHYNKRHNIDIPVRSPVSWFRKFTSRTGNNGTELDKKCKTCFSEYDNMLLTPAAIEGMKLMMWKKLAQTTVGVMDNRMEKIKTENLRSPNLLCDLIYGQPDLKNLEYLINHYNNETLLDCMKFDPFSAEFMFHLGQGQLDKNKVPHGINFDYFEYRIKELQELNAFNLEKYINDYDIEKVTYSAIK